MPRGPEREPTQTLAGHLRREWSLILSIAACAAFAAGGTTVFDRAAGTPWLPLISVSLFLLLIIAALSVVRHAEQLAHRLGEPLGTLVLTLSVIAIEVTSISAVMVHGQNNPTLVRDTLFAVIMIVLNGMVGMSLLLGGWVHREQHYNLQGANAYMSVIVPLAVLSLILPNFTLTTPGPTLSVAQQLFLAAVSVGLYGIFLAIQTGRHRNYFDPASTAVKADTVFPPPHPAVPWLSALFVLAYLAPIIYLAELLAHPIDYLIEARHAPAALGGVIIAILVASPEALGAIKAARANQMQRSMNISLGSVLSTIGLTIPAMLLISQFTGRPFALGLQHTDIVLLLLTLFSSSVTFASGRTNILQGCVHLLLFLAYLMLIFQN
jgi:Ca2+:H+ antiporter